VGQSLKDDVLTHKAEGSFIAFKMNIGICNHRYLYFDWGLPPRFQAGRPQDLKLVLVGLPRSVSNLTCGRPENVKRRPCTARGGGLVPRSRGTVRNRSQTPLRVGGRNQRAQVSAARHRPARGGCSGLSAHNRLGGQARRGSKRRSAGPIRR
jgi:hypothetical protein